MVATIRHRALLVLIGAAGCLLTTQDGQAQGCRLTLKNGNVISSPYCYEQDGVVYISKLGGTVGMHRRDVAKIERIDEQELADLRGAPDSLAAARKITENSGKTPTGKLVIGDGGKKAQKAVRIEKERPFHEFKSFEDSLTIARTNEAIACARASEPMTPAISGEDAGARIKARHDASESCQYYKNRIPEMEKKLEELRDRCGSNCR